MHQHETSSEVDLVMVLAFKGSAAAAAKKKKIPAQKFHQASHKTYPCLVPPRKGGKFVFCTTCKADFSCKHGGRFDCKQHVDSKSHMELDKATGKFQPIGGFFLKKDTVTKDTLVRDTTRAEEMISQLIVDGNLPMATAKKQTNAVKLKVMFPDSKIASSK